MWLALLYEVVRERLLAVGVCIYGAQVEDATDSLSSAHAQHTATAALSESLIKGADSALSLWVFKLSKRLHINKINNIRGTRGECGVRHMR